MKFKIAEHVFSLSIPERYLYMLGAYRPFECDDSVKELYSVEVVDSIDYEVVKPLLEDLESSNRFDVKVDVYQTTQGMLYNITMPSSKEINAQLHIVQNTAFVEIKDGNKFHQESSFTNTMMLSYMTYTLAQNTLLMHASAILKDGAAHLFIAKSGTGKSTHSQMWQDSYSDAELLNDDHPVLRRHDNGEVLAYGSPWSGKTPCYRNLSAPLAAIIRIKRADHNKLTRLSTLRAYASVITSSAGMQWSKELAVAKIKSLESIITQVGCYEIECLPNKAAAVCCYESLCAER